MLHLSKITLERLSAFYDTLKNLIDQLGVIAYPYLSQIFKLINAAIRLSTMLREKYSGTIREMILQAKNENVPLTDDNEVLLKLVGKWKNLYQVALKRTTQIYNKFYDWELPTDITESLVAALKDNIETLYIESSSNVSLLLKLFLVWSKHDSYIGYFTQFREIVPAIVKIYGHKKAKAQVLEVVNQFLFSICEFAHPNKKDKDMDLENEADEVSKPKPGSKEEENASTKAKRVLKDNINFSISSIQTYFRNQLSNKNRKSWRPSLKITKILVHLSIYVEESSLCNDLLGLLQHLIDAEHINKTYDKKRRSGNSNATVAERTIETLNNVLWIFVNFFKHSTQQEKFYSNLLDLVSELYVEAPREGIVQMILSLQPEKFQLSAETIQCMEALNKYSKISYRTLNYGSIVPVCSEINEHFLNRCTFEDQRLILAQYSFFLTQEELSLRMAATVGFKQFFEIVKENITTKGPESVHERKSHLFRTQYYHV